MHIYGQNISPDCREQTGVQKKSGHNASKIYVNRRRGKTSGFIVLNALGGTWTALLSDTEEFWGESEKDAPCDGAIMPQVILIESYPENRFSRYWNPKLIIISGNKNTRNK